jgi:hypothetical protein
MITSPPYLNVTRYEEDQWLRLWFLGGAAKPTYGTISKDDRHSSPKLYWAFLEDSWRGVAPLLKDSARIVIRLGASGLGEEEMEAQLENSVRRAFPAAKLLMPPKRSSIVGRQTRNFLPSSSGCLYELDFIFEVGP